MTHREFLTAFEECRLAEFHHRDHIRVAWCYLQRAPLLSAIEQFTVSLKRFAAAQGRPQLYHQTITWAYLFLIHERMSAGEEWEAFASRNPELFAWKPSILDRYYHAETLSSDLARHSFVLPDASL